MELYHLHPIAVHFPIALLLIALAGETLSLLLKDEKWGWLIPAAEWILWVGTLSAWIAIGLGLLAEETAPHVPSAWEVFEDHETLGFWSAGLFSALSLLRFYFKKQWYTLDRKWRWIFVAAWVISTGVLIATGFYGGQLVFHFGMGVTQHRIP